MDLPVAAELTILICTALGSVLGTLKFVARDPQPAIPHAKNGFLSLAELQEHCSAQQNVCTKVLMVQLTSVQKEITDRLDRGDIAFKRIGLKFKIISESIESINVELKGMNGK